MFFWRFPLYFYGMKKMKYIFYNILEIIRKEKLIFFVMIICILSSAFVLNFTYGLFYNYNLEKSHQNQSLREIAVEINKEHAPTHRQVRNFVESLSEGSRKNIRFYFSSKADTANKFSPGYYNIFESRFIYRNSRYGISDELKKTNNDYIISGRILSDEDEESGNTVAVIPNNFKSDSNYKKLILNDNIKLFNKEYNIIGYEKTMYSVNIPFLSIPDDFVYDDVIIISSEDIFNRSQYEEIKLSAMENMPDAVTFPDLPLPDTDNILLYNNLILITALLAILAVLNFAILYNFIIEKRSRETAVMRITGCSRAKTILINLLECVTVSIPIYAVGTAFYALILNISLKNIFDYISEAYSLKVYLYVFAFYFVTMLIIMFVVILKHINKSIVTEWKEAKK